jgi:ABC-type multidrug transport system ATPase subunit
MQEDALMATATPREAMEFSARLRLPNTTTPQEIKALVDGLVKDLGLEKCADTMIGGALIKGISGGQKKRTSVGVELITDPALVFLDEPTSGLDSYSAYNLVQLLKSVSESNSAVLCTIHQPSSEVFFLFDILIFLKAGRIFYQGPPKDLLLHLSKGGFMCPENYNPSDYIMFVCEMETNESLEQKGLFMHRITTGGNESEKVVDQYLDEVVLNVKASFHKQLYWLCYRELLNTKRDVASLVARFGITIGLNLIFGLIFLNAGGKDDSNPVNFNSHFGAIVMILISSMFGPAQSAMLEFPFQRPLFMREYATGTCKPYSPSVLTAFNNLLLRRYFINSYSDTFCFTAEPDMLLTKHPSYGRIDCALL